MITNYFRAYYNLRSMMKSAYWKSEKLDEHQNKELKHIIKHAYEKVPFYHDWFRKSAMTPDDIRGVKDLNKLPIIRKSQIRENPEAFISVDYPAGHLKRLFTSGSTGQPLFLYINQAEDEIRKAKHLRANTSCGQRIWDRWVIITSPHHFGASTRLQRRLGIYVPTPVSVFNSVAAQASIIEKMKPDVLDGYSSSLLLLAKDVKRRGLETIRPRFVIGGAELIDAASLKFVEDVFGVPFYDQYSCIEFDRISWQCPEKAGYHMDTDTLVIQFMDGNEDVSPGESGEVVCTSLFNYAMPLVRYAIGDVGVKADDECPCGRTLPLMQMIEGRCDSLLALPNGRIVSPRALTVAMSMFEYYECLDQFRIVQKKIDFFEIYLKMKEGVIDRAVVEQELAGFLETTLSLGKNEVTFAVKFVKSIPIDKTGKLMMVVSELQKGQKENLSKICALHACQEGGG